MSTASVQFPTSDLRHGAKEYKRDQDHKAKWARGTRFASGKWCTHPGGYRCDCPTNVLRPEKRDNGARPGQRNDRQHNINGLARGTKTAFRHEVHDEISTGPSDSSADEDVKEASAAPEPDAGVAYSYDAARGPGKGSQILSMALTQAVERYENKETEKLAKEYEFVARETDTFSEGYVADDDFELINAEC